MRWADVFCPDARDNYQCTYEREYVIRLGFEGQVKARNDGSGSRRNCASL